MIATSAYDAYLYACCVIQGRFPEGEKTIATSPGLAYFYAYDIIRGRWIEAEETIATDSHFWRYYKDHFKISWHSFQYVLYWFYKVNKRKRLIMLYSTAPNFVSVSVRGQQIWMDQSDFETMALLRKQRIENGRRYNSGRWIRDQFADVGQHLEYGGEGTVWEVSAFAQSEDQMILMFGKNWAEPLPGESRKNPNW